jgi:hypothetical protein
MSGPAPSEVGKDISRLDIATGVGLLSHEIHDHKEAGRVARNVVWRREPFLGEHGNSGRWRDRDILPCLWFCIYFLFCLPEGFIPRMG